MRLIHAEHAWLGGPEPAADVLIEIGDDGRFGAVTPGVPARGEHRPGLTLPGLANAHSHAFHRALRGRTHTDRGTFWTWRERMYEVASTLDPDSYLRLARAAYAEMALAGITCVGEFHYLHHGPGGVPYADPNAMGHALIEAARQAGVRITLLDTLYLTSGVDGAPLDGVQRRFGDGDLDGWSARVEQLKPAPHARIGAALHSVRAVPRAAIRPFAERAPLAHVHLSEQPAENEQCRAAYGRTPAQLLHDGGLLRRGTTAVHATHLTEGDVQLLGGTHTGVCVCPTTERDLADGIGPARTLARAGSALSLGSDSHAVIDPFEELRGLELHERLASRQRGRFAAHELLAAAANHAAIGWDDAGRITPGARADLVTVALDSVRTAGCAPAGALYAATAADVTHVTADGRDVVTGGRHRTVDVAAELREAIA
ncbi:formimidoylglutamate deiminase [Spirilliplanes yamanashiensis]|uniref:Formimidoylglutamate deiminase n=1 Tax=Spirilliplanes yamanashiensis TaxID=42233 RepID=A0A8J4DM08_9ACTN|nr:formimidoylglutamate deiminase [Spirilliplanes yamanashiensis]MDP9816248.1 formiminoglutamate deiminase [Spirilliplanes yamanashiensis]GIJ05774.1 formimidoylglutamate deiminase [Spirilliplanes yamanashiensis]